MKYKVVRVNLEVTTVLMRVSENEQFDGIRLTMKPDTVHAIGHKCKSSVKTSRSKYYLAGTRT